MKILVTGVAGFIGSHLSEELLKSKHQVIGIDNFSDFYDIAIKHENLKKSLDSANFTFVRADIRDREALEQIFKKQSIDLIIHLAAMAGVRPSILNPEIYFDVNVNGSQNLFKIAKDFSVKKIIFASSSSVYGANTSIPFRETDRVDSPISPYGMSKKINEVMAYTFHSLYNLNMIGLRFFTVYGPRQRPDLAIHKFTKMINNNEPIPFFGNGSTQRDYTYISDIIDGIMKSVHYLNCHDNVFEIFNLGESETTTLSDLVSLLEMHLAKSAKLKHLPFQKGDLVKTYADIQKAVNLLNYEPKIKLSQGIPLFVQWYKALNGF